MKKCKPYTIEFFYKDKLTSLITVEGLKVSIENYTDNLLWTAFGVNTNPTYKDFEDFLEDRCFPRTRDRAKEILKSMGLDYYDPFLICRQTHGVLHGDFLWLRWEDQKDFTWEDVKEILGISH